MSVGTFPKTFHRHFLPAFLFSVEEEIVFVANYRAIHFLL
jgi:hypothetical protein